VLEVTDATFDPGAPLDEMPERSGPFDLLASGARSTPTRDRYTSRTDRGEGAVDGRFAVTAVRRDGARGAPEPGFDAGDGGREEGRVGRVADVHAVVDDDAVAVVEDLGEVAELDGPPEPAFHDRAGVAVMQRHHPGGVRDRVTVEGTVASRAPSAAGGCCGRPFAAGEADRMKHHRSVSSVGHRSPAFAGFQFPPEVILLAVRWYLRYGLSYRDLEELLAERGIDVDHVTLYRWVQRFTPLDHRRRPAMSTRGRRSMVRRRPM